MIAASAHGGPLRPASVRVLAWSPALLAAAVVLFGLATPGYAAAAETVSALAAPGRRWAWPVRAVFVAYGVVVGAAAVDLAARWPGPRRAWCACLLAFAAGTVVAGCSPKGVAGTAPTTAGTVHVVAALVAVGALLVVIVAVAAGSPSRGERAVSAAAALVVLAGSWWFRQSWGTDRYGVAERAVLLAAVGWLGWQAALVLRPRPAPPGAGR